LLDRRGAACFASEHAPNLGPRGARRAHAP
jgi:hypothetical protein